MTTSVTVDTHAGWPVEITHTDSSGTTSTEVVPPNSSRTVHVWDTRTVTVRELRADAADSIQSAPAQSPE